MSEAGVLVRRNAVRRGASWDSGARPARTEYARCRPLEVRVVRAEVLVEVLKEIGLARARLEARITVAYPLSHTLLREHVVVFHVMGDIESPPKQIHDCAVVHLFHGESASDDDREDALQYGGSSQRGGPWVVGRGLGCGWRARLHGDVTDQQEAEEPRAYPSHFAQTHEQRRRPDALAPLGASQLGLQLDLRG